MPLAVGRVWPLCAAHPRTDTPHMDTEWSSSARPRMRIRPFATFGFRYLCECGNESPPLQTPLEAFLLWETHRLVCPQSPTQAQPAPLVAD